MKVVLLMVSNLAQYPLKVVKMDYCRKKERQRENDGALDKERAKRSKDFICYILCMDYVCIGPYVMHYVWTLYYVWTMLDD